MTPAQLTELRDAIPGDWKQDFDVGRETVTWFMPIGDGANLYAWIGDFNCNRWETDGDRTLSVEFTAGGSYQVTAGTFFDAARLLRESGADVLPSPTLDPKGAQ